MEWDLELESFQHDFVIDRSRFPAMVSGWATGKTLCAIIKGVNLSLAYPNNLGVILRRNFVDLKDSTLADYERYTRRVVKRGDKSDTFFNGSKILFHHADELAGVIQNINLGWFFIEQAEEFDNDEVFQKLRGRLRRSGCLRQGFIIANANGHNWVWRTWKRSSSPDFPLYEATTFDNARNLPHISRCCNSDFSIIDGRNVCGLCGKDCEIYSDYLEDLESMKVQSPANYRRYVLNSHEDTDVDDRCIPYSAITDAIDANLVYLGSPRKVIACDPAEFGDDKTVIMAIEEGRVVDMEVTVKQEPMVTAGKCIKMKKVHGAPLIAIDSIGIGSGVRSRIAELGFDVIGINSGERSSDGERFKNKRAEMWMHAQEMFRERRVSIPDQHDLIEDLNTVRYRVNSAGQVQIESKKDIKRRLGRSNDYSDCLILGLFAMESVQAGSTIEIDDNVVAESYAVETAF